MSSGRNNKSVYIQCTTLMDCHALELCGTSLRSSFCFETTFLVKVFYKQMLDLCEVPYSSECERPSV
jgi:hypothetical protein